MRRKRPCKKRPKGKMVKCLILCVGVLMAKWIVEGQDVKTILGKAIRTAESNPRNRGVLSVKTKNPGKVLGQSVSNNLDRWSNDETPAPWIDEKPKKFVDFMQRRWAPIGAENDPDDLNKNWAKNVRAHILKQIGIEKYKKWQNLDLVKNKILGTARA